MCAAMEHDSHVQKRALGHGHHYFPICDRIWENPSCSESYEILVSCVLISSALPIFKSETDRTWS